MPSASRPATPATANTCRNLSSGDVLVLEIGTRAADDSGYYSEIDMVAPAGGRPAIYTRRDGTPYDDIERRGPDAAGG